MNRHQTDNRVRKPAAARASAQTMRETIPARVAQAALRMLAPLARLFVAHGLRFADAEKLLKQAFFEAGMQELSRAGIEPNMSRISVTTGLHRKDVKLISEAASNPGGARAASRARGPAHQDAGSHASALYTRWTTDPAYKSGRRLRDLPLRAPPDEPSFEALARAVSTDAHPRALLEELKRLGLVEIVAEGGSVRLKPGGFIPLFERSEMLALLGDNLADHLETAVGNVLEAADGRLEQAVFMEGLSAGSVAEIEALSRSLWTRSMQLLVRALNRLGKDDAALPALSTHRIRVGMYFYSDLSRENGAGVSRSAQP